MLYRIAYLIIIFLSGSLHSGDFEKYKTAYDYISKDTTALRNWFTGVLPSGKFPTICVSTKVIFISQIFFYKDLLPEKLVDYDSSSKNNKSIDSLMIILDTLYQFNSYNDKTLERLNCSNCNNLIIFFSKINKEECLQAVVVPMKEGIEDRDKPILNSDSFWAYYFEFKKNKIANIYYSNYSK